MLNLQAAEYMVMRAVIAVLSNALGGEPNIRLVEIETAGSQQIINSYSGQDGDKFMGLLRKYAVKITINPATIYTFTVRIAKVPEKESYCWLPIDVSWHQQHEPEGPGLSAYESNHGLFGFDSTIAFCMECGKTIPAHQLNLTKDQLCSIPCGGQLVFMRDPHFMGELI